VYGRGVLQISWTRPNISLVFKNGSKSHPGNYRPVRVTGGKGYGKSHKKGNSGIYGNKKIERGSSAWFPGGYLLFVIFTEVCGECIRTSELANKVDVDFLDKRQRVNFSNRVKRIG